MNDENGYNKKHEEHHVKIVLKYWNKLVDELQDLEQWYCSDNFSLAKNYAEATIWYYQNQAELDNAMFDYNEYIHIGRTQNYYMNKVVYDFKRAKSTIKKRLDRYNNAKQNYYKKVENKAIKKLKIKVPASPQIKNYTSPIK